MKDSNPSSLPMIKTTTLLLNLKS